MSNTLSYSRRTLLQAILGLVATSGLSNCAHWVSLNSSVTSITALQWRACLHDPIAAGKIGREFLLSHTQNITLDTLVNTIATAVEPNLAFSPTYNRAQLQQALIATIQADFQQAQVVQVDGWLLSETETRMYAVAALMEAVTTTDPV